MPRPLKFRGLTEPKEIRLKLPGAGLPNDRLRVSSETRDRTLYVARTAMFKDLHEHGHYDLLRARQEGRVTTERLHRAYRPARPEDGPEKETLADVKRAVTGGLLAPLVTQWQRAYRGKDRARTFARVTRFLGRHGGASATTACLTAAHIEQHLSALTNAVGRANRKHAAGLTAAKRTAKGGVEIVPARPPRPASNATKNRHRGTLSALCTWLVVHGHLATHPIAAKRVEKFDEPDARMPAPFSPEEYRVYLEAARQAPFGDECAVFALLLLHTAADLGEVLSRTVAHVQLARAVPRVEFKRTKIKKARTREVPIPAPVAVALRGLIAHRLRAAPSVEQPLFQVTEKEVRAAHEAARTAIGRTTLRIKDLRHIAIIAWAKAGIRIDRIADLAGHTRLDQTRDYARYLPDTTEESDIAAGSFAQLAGPAGVTPITATPAKRVS